MVKRYLGPPVEGSNFMDELSNQLILTAENTPCPELVLTKLAKWFFYLMEGI